MVSNRKRNARRSIGFAVTLCLAFVLQPVQANGEDDPLWCFAWITDTQTPDCRWLQAVVTEVMNNDPRLVIHTGDTRFEWANQCAWRDALAMLRIETPPIEFHLAPGNHDLEHGYLKRHLRRAATEGVYTLDTGRVAAGQGYYQNRIVEYAQGEEWPVWNPEVINHPAWQTWANQPDATGEKPPYRYVFKRGGIRFIVCDCYYSQDQRDWIRDLIVRPDDSSVSILFHHKHEANDLAKYFEGLEGRHNVKLVLTGDHHNYVYEERHGVTFITSAGMAEGHLDESDAMTMWVYEDHLRLDRHVLAKGRPMKPIEKPVTIWTCEGEFTEYKRPGTPQKLSMEEILAAPVVKEAPPRPERRDVARTLHPNLLYNGSFDNGVWYERFRGWAPTGWYQWFAPVHAPEHVAEKAKPHSGNRYVRMHMWAHAFCAGLLQNVSGVEPCHYYRLVGHGFYQPPNSPGVCIQVGIDPCGALKEQFGVDVSKHPAPKYNEAIGDNPKTPEVEPGMPDSVVWSDCAMDWSWGRFEVAAEARSDTITAILSCVSDQRDAGHPIYEMNWDTISLREVPWPTTRLVPVASFLEPDARMQKVTLTIQRDERTAQVVWRTEMPAGASQVVYRFLTPGEAGASQTTPSGEQPDIPIDEYPFETPVVYERGATQHWVEIEHLSVPGDAVEIEVVALSRALVDGECRTLASAPNRMALP
jgi:hypothetical protein